MNLTQVRAMKLPGGRIFDRSLFFIAFAIGAIGIILLKSLGLSQLLVTLFPVLIMALYLAHVLWSARFRLREDQAGDQIYYLGFLFTLTSLAVALYLFSSGEEGTDAIIRNFGIALSTTIVGLAGRVLLNSMREDPVETEREARLELAEAASRLRGELDNSVLEFNSFRRSLQQTISEGMEETARLVNEQLTKSVGSFSEAAKQVLAAIENAFSEFSENAKKLNSSSSKTVSALARLVERVEAIEAPANLIEEKLGPMLDQLKEFAGSLEKSTKADYERWRAAVDDLERSVHSIGSLSSSLVTKLEHLDALFEKVSSSAEKVQQVEDSLVRATGELSEALSAQLSGLSSLAERTLGLSKDLDRQFSELLARHREHLDSVGEGAKSQLQSHFATLTEDVSRLSSSIGNLASVSELQLEFIKEHNQALGAELARARTATTEVEEALAGMVRALAEGLKGERQEPSNAPPGPSVFRRR